MTENISELTYWVTLAHMKGVKPELRYKIVKNCIEKNILLSQFFDFDPLVLSLEFLLNEKEISSIDKVSEFVVNNAFLVDDLLRQGYKIITLDSENYPKKTLAALKEKSPIVLYVKGNINLLNHTSIAIVGSRNASKISLIFTDNIAKLAIDNGDVVVSGYAKGVDQQALESTLKYGGCSIIVLPQGIMTFSSGFKKLYRYIVEGQVTVISSFYPLAKWEVGLAMARNSIVYSLSNKVYIAESNDSGGTWEGAMEGIKRKQNIYIRKPSITEQNANNLLIKNGAIAVSIDGNLI